MDNHFPLSSQHEIDTVQATTTMKKILLVISCVSLAIGACLGPLIVRLYFLNGGKSVWLSGWLQTAGCPIFLAPLSVSLALRLRNRGANAKLFLMTPFLFMVSAAIGTLMGLINYIYSYGYSKIPVSTASLIYATQLAFTAGFSFLLVKQKFNVYSINTVILMTVAAVVLAVNSSSDRPKGESNMDYVIGLVMSFVGTVLCGFVQPLIELTHKKAKQGGISYTLVMEYHVVMCIFATLVSTIGMVINNDFKEIAKEAREYEYGEANYYCLLLCNAFIWQCFFVGVNGVISCSSSLLCGILCAATLPVTELLAVMLYHEQFQDTKCVSLILSLLGFVSYFYGEIKYGRKKDESPELSTETEALLVFTQ